MSHSSKNLSALTAILLLAPCHIHAATFDEQRATVAAAVETQTEDAILSLLKAGITENRPAPAVALADEWLRRNLPKNPATLFQAARAAELSGELKNAIAFHQQALKLADPKSAEAGESITAVHTLLIYRLDDPAAAYSFAQTEAARLSVNQSFRQFDKWFLDEAIKRNDPTALANRLNATIAAGVPADLLDAHYNKYFGWLLDAVDGLCDQPGKPLSQDLYNTVKDLSAAITHSEEMKLRLDCRAPGAWWPCSARPRACRSRPATGLRRPRPLRLRRGKFRSARRPSPENRWDHPRMVSRTRRTCRWCRGRSCRDPPLASRCRRACPCRFPPARPHRRHEMQCRREHRGPMRTRLAGQMR